MAIFGQFCLNLNIGGDAIILGTFATFVLLNLTFETVKFAKNAFMLQFDMCKSVRVIEIRSNAL